MKKLRKIDFYKILNKQTNKVYVGYTTNFKVRKRKHLAELKRGCHHSQKLQRSYDKHKLESFSVEVFEEGVMDIVDAYKREVELVAEFDSFHNGYNMTMGGEGIHGHFGELHWKKVKIYQYDLQGNYIQSFPTIKEASMKIYGASNGLLRFNSPVLLAFGKYLTSRVPQTKDQLCKIHRYDLNGDYMDSFYSETCAARLVGGNEQNITRAIKIKGTYLGYQWSNDYKSDIGEKVVSSKENTRKGQGRAIIQLDKITEAPIREYEVIADAIREYGWSISSCIRGLSKTAYGFKWKYKK